MKLLIVCSTSFYNKIPPIKEYLQNKGYELTMPNNYEDSDSSHHYEEMTEEEYLSYFKRCYQESHQKISLVDAVLVLNYDKEKNGTILKNYIGASTFLEMYEAYMQDKKIYLLNDFPENMLLDEIKGFNPTILNNNLENIK